MEAEQQVQAQHDEEEHHSADLDLKSNCSEPVLSSVTMSEGSVGEPSDDDATILTEEQLSLKKRREEADKKFELQRKELKRQRVETILNLFDKYFPGGEGLKAEWLVETKNKLEREREQLKDK